MKLKLLMVIFSCALTVGCGKIDSNSNKDEDSDTKSATFEGQMLPQLFEAISPINLSYEEDSSNSLNLARNLQFKCKEPRNDNLGIFGGLWYYACVLSEASEKILYGQVDPYLEIPKAGSNDSAASDSAQDSPLDATNLTAIDGCSKVINGDKTSFFSILCQLKGEDITDEVLDVGSDDDPLFVGVSFAEITGLPSSGSFSDKGFDLPLGSRIWDGASENNLTASYAVALKNENEGSIHIFYDFADHDAAQSEITYKQAPKEADCAASLKREDCHYQQFSFYAGDETDTMQKGMSFTVLANKKKRPNLIVVEGTWLLTESQSNRLMALTPGTAEDTLFEAGRKLYFRMIKKDRLIWAQYIIRDENDQIIPGAGVGAGKGAILAEEAGHCMNFDEKANGDDSTAYGLFDFYPCGEIDFADLVTKFTVGESKVKFIEAPLPISELDFDR
jgi:hypothetical protein